MSESVSATVSTTNSDGAIATTMGDAASTSQINSSASASVPSMPAAQAPANDFKSLLGDFAADPAFQSFKDVAGLAKSYKETKALVGQKLGVPGPDATAEQKAAFDKALGIPETPEGYSFETPADLPESVKEHYATELKTFAAKAKELGLTPAQAKAIQASGTKEMLEAFKAREAAQAEVAQAATKDEVKFDAIATKMYGDKKEEKLQAARAGIEEFVPAEFREGLGKWTTEQLLVFSQFADGVAKKYTGKEDRVINAGESPVGGGSASELREEAKRLAALPEHDNPFVKGKDAHEAVKKRVKDLYAQIGTMK